MDFEIREDKQTRGAKLRREREEYFRLMKLGYGNKEASRLVGINSRTGREWRNGRPEGRKKRPRAPAHIAQAPSGASSRFLSETERIHITDRAREKATVRAIAAELGRSSSTISREIRRNRTVLPNGQTYYRPYAAQRRADARRPRPKPGKIRQSPELRDFIQDRLAQRWSPEQICRALRRSFPDRPEMHVAHETIYQALYVQGRGELRRELTRALRTGRAMRKPHRQSNKRQPRYTTPMLMISDRPAEASDRAIPGHGEGDRIVGVGHRSAIGTLVERTTRFTMLIHLPNGHRAEHFHPRSPTPSSTSRPTCGDLSPGTRATRWPATTSSPPRQTCRSTSAIPVAPGSAARTRTRTACSGSTSPRALTCPGTVARSWTPSRPSSTPAHARRSAGKPQPSVCLNCWPPHVSDHVLRRSLEFAEGRGGPHSSKVSMQAPTSAENTSRAGETQPLAFLTGLTSKRPAPDDKR